MNAVQQVQNRLGKKIDTISRYFMPPDMLKDRQMVNQTRMFLVSHFLGPVLGLSVPLAFYLLDPTPGFDLIILAASILMFWLFPFLLKAGIAYDRLVLMSIAIDWFVIFWSCYFYGGASSPTVVWFLIIPILAVFYIGGDGRQKNGLLVLSCAACAIFAIAYLGIKPDPNDIPVQRMETLSLLSAIAVMFYIAGMSVYFARVFDAGVEFEREVERRHLLAIEYRLAVDEATRAASAKSEFLARMSHELRSPLNAIVGYGELLKEEDIDDPDPVVGQDIDRILDAGKYLGRLIDMVLDLAKIESGKMLLDLQEHDIGAVIAKVVEKHRQAIEDGGNTLTFRTSDDLSSKSIDANRLGQIANSIIENAAAYTADGQIAIELKAFNSTDNPSFALIVRDTGKGISQDALPYVFENFITDRDAAEGRYGGTGLALSVTSKLCEAMNGKISVDSREGDGTTFTVELPLLSATSDAKHTEEGNLALPPAA